MVRIPRYDVQLAAGAGAWNEGKRHLEDVPLTVTFLAPDSGTVPTPPRVAFAVGKSTGGAVLRNRIRRRLRAALRELLVTSDLPAGTYLLGATAAVSQMPWSELLSDLSAGIGEVTR